MTARNQAEALAALVHQIEGSVRPEDQLTPEERAYYDHQRAADAHYNAEVEAFADEIARDADLIARGVALPVDDPDDDSCGRCGGVLRYPGAPCGDCDAERT